MPTSERGNNVSGLHILIYKAVSHPPFHSVSGKRDLTFTVGSSKVKFCITGSHIILTYGPRVFYPHHTDVETEAQRLGYLSKAISL